MNISYRRYFFVLFFLYIPQAWANIYEVTPTQLFLSAKQTIGVVKVTNQSDEISLLQLSLLDWTQCQGKDTYQVSHDILMTPPLFRLPPHKTQIIRFALKHPIFNTEQKSYRMHIKEVNLGRKKRLGQSLYFLIDLSLPLFVQPRQIIEQFVWSAKHSDTHHIKLKLYNDGNVTLFVNQWQLIALSAEQTLKTKKHTTFAYILPHQSHSWIVTVNSSTRFMDIRANINGKNKKSALHIL